MTQRRFIHIVFLSFSLLLSLSFFVGCGAKGVEVAPEGMPSVAVSRQTPACDLLTVPICAGGLIEQDDPNLVQAMMDYEGKYVTQGCRWTEPPSCPLDDYNPEQLCCTR
jgi:hypothetical protein